jgi:alpha-galactosidase
MPKIAIIGAGSMVFTQAFLNDMFATPCLKDATYALMGPTLSKLKGVEKYAKKVIQKNNLEAQVYCTTDRRDALIGADYVITILQIGGKTASAIDIDIPKKYGINQAIGDTLGPGGVFRALRTIPVMIDIAKDIEEFCPKALVLNYVNPMAVVCLALGKATNVNFVGLCHGVQTTIDLISRYVGVKKEEIDYVAAGINHMAWFLELKKNGQDLYPILKENSEKPEYYINEKVRIEVMRHLGYFMTESSHHLSEYLPWFRKNKDALNLYCDQERYGDIPENNKIQPPAAQTSEDFFSFENGDLEPRSVEYCSYIIEAMETGKIFRLNGNVMNKGYITNLPQDCCVEVPVYVDRMGIHPTYVGALPAQLAALNQSNVTVQTLAAEAALKGDMELAFNAIAMDPLTSSVLTLQEIRDMVFEMFEASRGFLPQFAGKSFPKTYGIHIPKGTVGVDVPMDPALSIYHRIEKLMNNDKKK